MCQSGLSGFIVLATAQGCACAPRTTALLTWVPALHLRQNPLEPLMVDTLQKRSGCIAALRVLLLQKGGGGSGAERRRGLVQGGGAAPPSAASHIPRVAAKGVSALQEARSGIPCPLGTCPSAVAPILPVVTRGYELQQNLQAADRKTRGCMQLCWPCAAWRRRPAAWWCSQGCIPVLQKLRYTFRLC